MRDRAMSVLDELDPAALARQLREPEGATGLMVADTLGRINHEGNQKAVRDLEVASGARVLELGCGTGAMARAVVADKHDVRYVGIDPSPTMVAAARARNADLLAEGRAWFCEGAAKSMPFAQAEFDRAFCVGVAHFWAEPVEALGEIRRVLRPGALLLIGCLGPVRAPAFSRAEFGFHLRTTSAWQVLFAQAGFVPEDVDVRELGSDGPQIISITARA